MRGVAWCLMLGALVACAPSRGGSPSGAYSCEDVPFDSADPARVATIYRPLRAADGPRPWIFAVHGGGFMLGTRQDCAVYAQEFCPLGYVVVSPSYHLTSEAGVSWPRPLRDMQAALRFFRSHAGDFGLDPGRFVAMGGSAGGCLVTHLALEDDPEGPLGRAPRAVDISGEQDLRLLGRCMSNDEQITTNLLGHPGPWTEDELLAPSNVQRARPDADLFVVHGTCNGDTYVLNSDLLVRALRAAGAQVEYHRVEGAGMWAASDPGVDAALRAWIADRTTAGHP
jgi:acetyl esterase/lipase